MQLPENYILYQFNEITSTNDLAIELAKNNKFSVIIAKKQTIGKGRNKNSWISPEGNLYMSIVFKAKQKTNSHYAFLTAVAIGDTLPNCNYQYKWPNDILIDGEKSCWYFN